jgi:hypothetical protein
VTYKWKGGQELLWAVVVAVAVVLAQAAFIFDPDSIHDWRTYALALFASAVRATGGAILAFLGKLAVTHGVGTSQQEQSQQNSEI